MIYHRDREKLDKSQAVIALIFVVLVVFLIGRAGVFSKIFGGPSKPAERVLSAGQSAETNSANFISAWFSSKKSLLEENRALRDKLSEAEAKLLDRDILLSENLELKTLLGRVGREKTVLAAVIGKPNQSPYDTLIIDIGSDNGVSVGKTVLAYGSVAIGTIEEASSSAARVSLFSSPGREYQAMLGGKNLPVKLVGRGGGNFLAELPREISLDNGTAAQSAGSRPYVLGTISSVYSDPRDPLQQILFRSPVNFLDLRFVEIVL